MTIPDWINEDILQERANRLVLRSRGRGNDCFSLDSPTARKIALEMANGLFMGEGAVVSIDVKQQITNTAKAILERSKRIAEENS